jgi:hypothetical protein
MGNKQIGTGWTLVASEKRGSVAYRSTGDLAYLERESGYPSDVAHGSNGNIGPVFEQNFEHPYYLLRYGTPPKYVRFQPKQSIFAQNESFATEKVLGFKSNDSALVSELGVPIDTYVEKNLGLYFCKKQLGTNPAKSAWALTKSSSTYGGCAVEGQRTLSYGGAGKFTGQFNPQCGQDQAFGCEGGGFAGLSDSPGDHGSVGIQIFVKHYAPRKDLAADLGLDVEIVAATLAPTLFPTPAYTDAPTTAPTEQPTPSPTYSPTTATPTAAPTDTPTANPTTVPSPAPTTFPTSSPSPSPTRVPTMKGGLNFGKGINKKCKYITCTYGGNGIMKIHHSKKEPQDGTTFHICGEKSWHKERGAKPCYCECPSFKDRSDWAIDFENYEKMIHHRIKFHSV